MSAPRIIHHASVILSENPVVYVDPWEISTKEPKADYIFVTHSHYDHLSLPDIKLLLKPGTHVIAPVECKSKLTGIQNLTLVEPLKNYNVGNIEFYTVPAYNINKSFHPKANKWVGYVITINGVKYYHPGDTDFIPEMKDLAKMNIDYAFFPVGGTYTMNAREAAEACEAIKPKNAIPMHYGKIVGSKADAETFKKLVKSSNVLILI